MIVAKKRLSGFTLVEILIVIVVIGILTAISVVAYRGVQKQADNSSRAQELISWQKAFESYNASFKTFPGPTPGAGLTEYQCLGSGFPNGSDGQPRCFLINTSTSWLESGNATVMSELKKVANVPPSTRKTVSSGANTNIGPVALYRTNDILLWGVFEGTNVASDCPKGTTYSNFGNNNFTICQITLYR